MVQPINYLANIPQPNIQQQFLGGIQSAVSLAEMKRAADLEQKNQQFKADFANILKNPSMQGSMELVAKYPEFADKIQAAKKLYSEEENKREFDYAVDATLAIESGNFDIAKRLTMEQIQALKNAGKPTDMYERVLKGLDENPRAAIGLVSAFGAGADFQRWKGITEAKMAQRMAEAGAKKEELTVEKLSQEIGLTKAQIAQAQAAAAASRASASKTGAEAARARAEAEQMARGVLPPEKRAAAEDKLRAEYNTQTKDFFTTDRYYRNIITAQDDAAGDLALIFSYMKLLDPGSAVMEGEQATVANAKGVPDRIRNAYNNALEGRRLSPDQVKVFTAQAEKLYDSAASREKQVRSGISRIANGLGVNTDNIFYQPGGIEKPKRPEPTPPATANPVINVQPGTPLSNAMERYGKPAGGQ